jgi:coenzyme F420 hydrogenase subunit beta
MTAAFAIRDDMNDIDEAPGKVWFWELERAVIDAGRCIQCGVCVAACPSDSLGIGPDDLPKLVKMCTGCSLCWDFCPRGGLRYEALGVVMGERSRESGVGCRTNDGETGSRHASENGHGPLSNGRHDAIGNRPPTPDSRLPTSGSYTARVSRTIPGVQDGGVVSALLIALLESGAIDGALVAKPSEREPWKGVAHLAQTAEDVVACAGSFYNQTLSLAHLDLKKYDLPPNPRIALVGTPCEIQGLRAMQARPFYWGASKVDAVVLSIALLCTKSFDYEGLMLREIEARRGIPLTEIDKIDIIRGKLYLYDETGVTLLEEPIRNFHGAALRGCDECADFLGVAADISVGSVGSADGYSSVLIWTEAGREAFERVKPRLEVRGLDRPQAIEKLEALDTSVALANLKRPFDPGGALFIAYDEHLDFYAGTDRAPVTHEPIRY